MKKILDIMKISTFLLFVCAFSALASKLHSQNAKVSINGNNLTIGSFIDQVEKQTDYLFVYSKNEVNTDESVSVSSGKRTVAECLNEAFRNSDIKYAFENDYVVLTRKSTLPSLAVTQHGKTVRGVVVDDMGDPVMGANVVVKGATNVGAITDMVGEFTLNVPDGAVLQVSYIGYVTKEVPVAGQSFLNIVLSEDTQALDEVIVVGYGTTTKRSLISSVSSIKTQSIAELPVSNITQQLAGRTPGIIVQASGGGVNNKNTVSIRGGGTPLVVIDGIIRAYDDFAYMNPNEIETMSILKDASATAVYGSRAAYGIIQITTKQGMAEQAPRINYDFQMSWSQPGIWPRKLDSWDRAYYANQARNNDGLTPSYSDEAIRAMRDGTDLLNYGNTDWQKLVLNDFAPQAKHNISMTGGSKTTNYYMSLGYVNQESLYKTNTHNMQRTNFRLSVTSLVEAIGLRTTASLDGYVQKTTHPYTSTASSYYHVFSHINDKSPLSPGVNLYGLPYNSTDNPVVETAEDAGYIKDRNKNINGKLTFEWSLPWVSGLSLRATGNYRYYVATSKQWRKDGAQYDWDSTEPVYANIPLLYHSTGTGYHYTMQYFSEYKKQFEKHNINMLGGYECTYAFSDSYWERRENYVFPIDQIGVGPESTQTNGGEEAEQGRAAWIAQAKYNYDNRYFIEGSMRYDGSDLFPEDHRWGTFFSGSVGWSLADEAFMESLREKNIFNLLKLRASYGQTGLDNWDSPYSIGRFQYLSSYNLNTTSYVINGAFVPGFSEGALPSPDLTWFTTDQFDLGFDFESLKNRLYGTLDYFYYKTSGFLYSPNALDVGYTAPLGQNLPYVSTNGEHRREGFDFQLGWRDKISDFTYDVSVNFTKFDQLWAMKPDENESSLMNPYKRASQQVGYYGNLLHNLGYYTSAEDVLNSVKRTASTNLTAGDIKYLDFNGDGKIDDSDMTRLGKSSFPRANYGINVNLGYKGFFANVLFQGATQFDMYYTDNNSQTTNLPVIYSYQKDYWEPDNTSSLLPRLTSSTSLNGTNNYQTSDFWLINGAYFRLKSFNIGYDFKKIMLKKVNWLTTCRLAVSGTNIFTISDATKYGLDPENSSTLHYGYPNERTYALSINLGF